MAARYCDRLILLSDGRVLAEGSPEDVLVPDIIESAFGVRSAVYRDPVTESLAISIIAPADVDRSPLPATGANGGNTAATAAELVTACRSAPGQPGPGIT